MTPALANDSRNIGMGIAVVGTQLAVTRGFLEGIEIRTLDIFDDRDFERFAITCFHHNNWNVMLSRPLGRAPPTLASDNLIPFGDLRDRANQDGLDDATLLYRRGQIVELCIIELLARITRVWSETLNGCFSRSALNGDGFGTSLCCRQ